MTYTENNHRYTLYRDWLGSRGRVNWIMLNPSVADDRLNDPTVRRCAGFAKRWGYSGISITNLFAYRATNPNDLKRLLGKVGGFRLAIGERSTEHLDREAKNSVLIVCAWGDNCDFMPERVSDVLYLLKPYDLYCIRLTKSGNPVHPVREPYTDAPVLFRARETVAA